MIRKLFTLALVLLPLLLSSVSVSAHEGREVGEYVIEFGWQVEPAFAGQYNGAEFTVEHHDTGEPVEGLESSLSLMVHYGDQSRLLEVYPIGDEPGHYGADLIPTLPGDYGFHLFGTIGELEVDEMFSSADGEFASIDPAVDIEFPLVQMPDGFELQAQIDDLRAEIEALKAELSS